MISLVQRLRGATVAVILLVLGMVASPTANAQYCEPCNAYQWNPGLIGIQRVQVGSFVRNSAPNEGAPCYYINTGSVITLLRNTNYTMTVQGAWENPTLYPIYHMVWIDINVDGDFFDAGETVYQGYPAQTWGYVWGWYYTLVYEGSVTFNLNLPCTVPQGTTRMRVGASYYNYMGSNPCIRNTYYSEWEDYTLDIAGDVTGSFPNDNTDQNSILTQNLYDGSSATFPKPSIQMRAVTANQQFEVTYRLQGPAPLVDNVYIGHQPGDPNDTTITMTGPATPGIFTYTIPAAKGIRALADGSLDARQAIGGEYQVFITVRGAGGGGCYTEWIRAFTIAVPNDLSTREIRSPRRTTATFRYPNTAAVPIEAQFQNVGLNVINQWRGHVNIWKDGVLKFTDTSPIFNEVLDPKERATVVFNSFTSTTGHEVGIYDIEVCSEMVDPNFDDNTFNDCFPRPSQTYRFEIAYNEEASAVQIVRPSATADLYVGRPHRVEGMFQNNGIIDLSNVPVELTVTRLSDNLVVYSRSTILPDLPAGQFNRSTIVFAPFTPDRAGMYQYCIKVKYPGDPVASNDVYCQNFEVKAALAGTYTIGTLKAGQPNNFPTFEAAADALYRRGVGGPVTFELTDASYTVGNAQTGRPALDLSSTIIGVNSTNKILFKPSIDRSLSKGSVTVRLRSGNGVGIFTGTNLFPANTNAIQSDAEFSSALYAKSNGNIHFDGGAQRSIKFLIDFTGTQHRSVLYFGPGSRDCSVKNCIISDFGTPSYATTLPQARYNSGSNEFRYDPDFTASATYSVGIVSRDTTPTFNQANLDTIPNQNLVFENNEISKFGYGIVTTGLGILVKSGVNQYTTYYNKGTQIRNNLIYDVRRAGVFVGYEDGAVIEGNRIYNVGVTATNGAVNDANGILAGGEGRYHNINLVVTRNEISGVVGNTMSRGIGIEQSRNDFQSVTGGVTPSYPNVPEHTLIHGNTIWGLRRGTAAGHMAGVHTYTRRATTNWDLNSLLTPFAVSYFTRGDTVANNTIVHQSDNLVGTGLIIGIGTQHANGPVVTNNAIALEGLSNATNSVHTALFNEGTMFRGRKVYTGYLTPTSPAALVSDRNAYYLKNTGSTIARFVEITEATPFTIVSTGTNDEFTTIAQWRSWTGQDVNSVVGNFLNDHVYLGIAPNQRLRVRTSPQTPIGSILSNRGVRITSIKKDIDNNDRGPAGQGFDLGANEFAGRDYVSDLEVVDIISPTSYRSLSGVTSDAEYIMTKAPVDVTSRIRNNGSLTQNQGRSRVRVFLETAASAAADMNPPVFSTTPVVDKTVNVALASGAESNYAYGLTNFSPQTFAQLAGYTAPSRYNTMTWNVTPRYRVEVAVGSDENNLNNTQTKVYRFYLMMAQTRIAVSTRGSATTLTPSSTQNEIAGRLNADSLIMALNRVGFVNNPSTNTFAYDVFDRNAWEGRAVDYTMYRTMFWSHDQNPMTRTERDDIRAFLAAGTMQEKKNFAMGSQEPPRDHVGMDVTNDEAFIRTVLRVTLQTPGSPINTNNYNGKKVVGQAIARNTEETILTTTWPGDAVPNPVLVRLYSDATTPGIALASYKYKKGDRTTNDSLGGAARASLAYNTVYLGVDWRHYQNTGFITGTERVVRGVIDFFETNGGTVVPVELSAFDAQARGTNVDVFWTTASEQNSDHFEVERAAVTPAGTTDYTSVAMVPAAGNTTSARDYRTVDQNVAPGTYVYRLKAVDMDGSSSLSHDVQVVIGEGSALSIGNVVPNPVSNEATVTVDVPSAGTVDIRLFDIAGNDVMIVANTIETAGRHNVTFSAMNLASGSYTLVVRSNGATASTPVTIVK